MDHQTHAEVGGPYSNKEDAERAIRAGNFSTSPANLGVEQGEPDDADDSKTASLVKQADLPDQVTTPGPVGADPIIPTHTRAVPDHAAPQTTKPAQVPSGGGGPSPVSPGGMMPQDFSSEQFQSPDTFSGDTPGNDAVSTAIASVAARVRTANPDMDDASARRVGRQVVGKLLRVGNGLFPNIEDPLANKTPLDVVKDVVKKKDPKPGNPTSHEEDKPDDEEEDHTPGAGAGAAARVVRPLLGEAAELAPLLLV